MLFPARGRRAGAAALAAASVAPVTTDRFRASARWATVARRGCQLVGHRAPSALGHRPRHGCRPPAGAAGRRGRPGLSAPSRRRRARRDAVLLTAPGLSRAQLGRDLLGRARAGKEAHGKSTVSVPTNAGVAMTSYLSPPRHRRFVAGIPRHWPLTAAHSHDSGSGRSIPKKTTARKNYIALQRE
jgi:hypothetical protein